MKNPLLRKILMMAALTLLLCIPLRFIGVTVWERASTRDQVRQDVAASMAGQQKLSGPVLVQPYSILVEEKAKDADGRERTMMVWRKRQHVWLPDQLTITGSLENSPRFRGIYQAQLYTGRLAVLASFSTAASAAPSGENIIWDAPYLALGLTDVRGISQMPEGTINKQPLVFAADSGLDVLSAGVHAPVDMSPGGHYEIRLNLDIKGMDRFDLMPLGRDTKLTLSSHWPHPSFQGRYLPDTQDISEKGFTAAWRSTFLATNIESQLRACMDGSASDCSQLQLNEMGVRLIEPVDVYLQSERALKYGFLFVLMAFTAFLLFELLKGLRIHAMQYLLVGAALILFFLLLIALAEHVRFAVAYAAAAAACVALLWFYVSFVLRSFWRGMSFAGLISSLFLAIYFLLQSEDYALLMGALLLFGGLAVTMILTRHLDWFALSDPADSDSSDGDSARPAS